MLGIGIRETRGLACLALATLLAPPEQGLRPVGHLVVTIRKIQSRAVSIPEHLQPGPEGGKCGQDGGRDLNPQCNIAPEVADWRVVVVDEGERVAYVDVSGDLTPNKQESDQA